MSHGNARTTVHGRQLIAARHLAGWPKAHIAAAMGISRTCVRTWITRFEDGGEAGLVDRSSRPHTSPTRTSVELEDRIVAARNLERRGPDWIGAELGVPARTVSRVLARRGQPRLSVLDPMTGVVIQSSKQTAIRCERSRSGELVHMDVETLGCIPDGGGWRALGRAPRDHLRPHPHVKNDVQALFSGGFDDPEAMTVVAVSRGESTPAVAPYGGSQRLLEAFLPTMAVWPASTPRDERDAMAARLQS